MKRNMHDAVRPAIVIAAASLTVMLAACATKPTFTVERAVVTEMTDDAVVVTFVLAGENTGEEPLLLKLADYTATVGGQSAPVQRTPEATLRANGSQRVYLPAAFKIPKGSRANAAPYAISGSIRYLPPGPVAAQFDDWGFYRPDVSFSATGSVDLSTIGSTTSSK